MMTKVKKGERWEVKTAAEVAAYMDGYISEPQEVFTADELERINAFLREIEEAYDGSVIFSWDDDNSAGYGPDDILGVDSMRTNLTILFW